MLGDRIKELRNKRCIYQQVLADALNVSKSTVAMWETNKREPDLEMIKKIAEYFNVSTDYLVNWERKAEKTKLSFEDDPWEFINSALAHHFPWYSNERVKQIINIVENLDRFNDAGLQAVEHHIDELSQIMKYLTEDEIQQREEEWESTLWQREEEQQQQLSEPIVQSSSQIPTQQPVSNEPSQIGTEQPEWRMVARSIDGKYVNREMKPEEVEIIESLKDVPKSRY